MAKFAEVCGRSESFLPAAYAERQNYQDQVSVSREMNARSRKAERTFSHLTIVVAVSIREKRNRKMTDSQARCFAPGKSR